MTYYSDEDRRRAALKRKRNSQLRKLRHSPEDAYDIMGVSVPYVEKAPTLSDYGLPANVEQLIAEEKAYEKNKRKYERMPIGFMWFFGFILLCFLYAYTTEDIANTIVLAFTFGLFFLIGLVSWVNDDSKLPVSSTERNYEKYKTQAHHFSYWARRKNKDFWNNMSGHAFEQAVANLFRNIGFSASVSNQGGDGGVDIVLQKGDRKIAVQCKRYKNSVGPHVVRDLWGTMHNLGFNEGCIVTTTGFTSGVVAFSKDKNIILVDLNDILRSTEQNGNIYLMRKMGEYV